MSLARRRAVQVGACATGICRDNPIPVGYYWIDSIEPAAFGADEEETQAAREEYVRTYASAYAIIRTVPHTEGQYDRDWILFQVKSPIPRWPAAAHWGLPTVAPRGPDTQEGDTVQKPPPEQGPLDSLFNGEGVPGWALVAAGAAGVLAILYALK